MKPIEIRELAAKFMRNPPKGFSGSLRCKLIITISEVGLFMRSKNETGVIWCLIHKCARLYHSSEYIDACDIKYDEKVVYPQFLNYPQEAEKHSLLDYHIVTDYCPSVFDDLYDLINSKLSCLEHFISNDNQKIYNKFYSIKNGFIMRDFEPLNACELAVLSYEFNSFGIETFELFI